VDCSKCGRSSESRYVVCAQCGHTDWGQLAGGLVIAAVCAAAFFYFASNISLTWLRAAVKWITGIVGGICLLASLLGIARSCGNRVGKGVRVVGLVLLLVLLLAGAILFLPSLGVKLPAFLPHLALVTVTPEEPAGTEATARRPPRPPGRPWR